MLLRDDDRLLDPERDALRHRERVIPPLARALSRAPTPFTIGLFGPWGSGKTGILRTIEAMVRDGAIENVLEEPIWFNAWKYEHRGDLLYALLQTVVGKMGLRAKAGGEWLAKSILTRAASLAVRTAGSILTHGEPVLGRAANALTELGKGVAAGRPSAIYEDWTDEIRALGENFALFANRILDTASEKPRRDKLVVLVDDLDRCQPDEAVRLLEGMKLLLADREHEAPVVFLLGLDRRIVAEAVARKYAGISSFDGERYLDKIIEHSFELPPLGHAGDGNYGELAAGAVAKLIDDCALSLGVRSTLPDMLLKGGAEHFAASTPEEVWKQELEHFYVMFFQSRSLRIRAASSAF
jgi:hypothetical protein